MLCHNMWVYASFDGYMGVLQVVKYLLQMQVFVQTCISLKPGM